MSHNLTGAQRRRWRTSVSDLKLSQPDPTTCQAACLAMAVGRDAIWEIRANLLGLGTPGDPWTMAKWAECRFPGYEFHPNGSLSNCLEWVRRGDLLITHGWFTPAGHVIVLDGAEQRAPSALGRISHAIPWTASPAPADLKWDVCDPWAEFDGPTWTYQGTARMFDGFYSSRLIWAGCVASRSFAQARYLYQKGTPRLDQGGMWVHRFPSQAGLAYVI